MSNLLGKSLQLLADKELGGNWAELSRRSGVPTTTLQSIKEGTRAREDTIVRISSAFGLSIDWLLTGEGPMRRNDSSEVKASPGKTQNSDECIEDVLAALVKLEDWLAGRGGAITDPKVKAHAVKLVYEAWERAEKRNDASEGPDRDLENILGRLMDR
ncbi:MAG: helix-turn-helix domain-containing protein [Magnetococcus sp. THC-1_WYH]